MAYLLLEPEYKWPGEPDLGVKVHTFDTLEEALTALFEMGPGHECPEGDRIIVQGERVKIPQEMWLEYQRADAIRRAEWGDAREREQYERLKRKFEGTSPKLT